MKLKTLSCLLPIIALAIALAPVETLAQGPPGVTPHEGDLSWTNPATSCTSVVTNVWRCSGNATACATGLFSLIATVPQPGTAYVDSTAAATNPVASGSTYTWELDAEAPIGSNCAGHSAPTAKVTATIPLSPSSPATFAVSTK